MSKTVAIDMDSVLADFEASGVFHDRLPLQDQVHKMYEPGFFLDLKPVDGALTSVRAIMRMGYDVHILSRPVAESAHSYEEKARWIGLHFPELIFKLHLTQEKGMFRADYLIDDDAEKWQAKWEAGGGKFIHFKYGKWNATIWHDIVEFLREELK